MALRLTGQTSGYVELEAPAVAGSNTLILPNGNGAANQVLKNSATAGTLEYGLTLPAGNGTAHQVLKNSATPGTLEYGVTLPSGNGTAHQVLKNSATAGTLEYGLALPTGNGTSGQYLQTDGAGGSSWQTVTPSTPIQILSVTGRQVATRNVLTHATMSNIRLGSATISSSDINSAAKVWEVSYTPTNSSGTARIDALLNSFCEDANTSGTYFGAALVAKNGTTWSLVDFEYLANDWDGVFDMWLTQSVGSVNDGATHLSLSGKVDVADLNTIAVIGYGDTSAGDISINDIGDNTTNYTTQQYTSFIQVTEY